MHGRCCISLLCDYSETRSRERRIEEPRMQFIVASILVTLACTAAGHTFDVDDAVVDATIINDELEECQDRLSTYWCQKYTIQGHCENRRYYMEENCRRTCGFCGCLDVRSYCPRYKSACVAGRRYHKIVSHVCRETCGSCVNGKWGGWGSWSSCSITCGGNGHMTRERSCNNPSPFGDGKWCYVTDKSRRDSVEIQSSSCNSGACPVKGNWGDWASWSSCSAQCGDGHVTRTRLCNNPPPVNGGEMCQVTDKSRRDSTESETKPCNAGPCPVNGAWGDWDPWSACSASCGGGHMTRRRLCNSPSPSHGGSMCEIEGKGLRDSSQTETQSCNTATCPAPCNDKSSRCPAWKSKCATSAAVQRRCPKTCGLCGTGTGSECKDKTRGATCERWKNSGRCTTNSIKDRCKKTCGACGVKPATTVPPTYPPIVQGICGRDTIREKQVVGAIVKKIVGGEEAAKHEWVWQGIMQYRGQFHCGGTLITPSLFLTAAHCVHQLDKDLIEIRMGYHTREGAATTGQIRTIQSIKEHENYKDESVNQNMIYNDIALIKVNPPFTLNKVVGVACLPEFKAPLPKNETCYVTGWGKTKPGGILHAKQLQEAQMSVKTYKKCSTHKHLTDHQFCGGGENGVISACEGDSGGPLVCKKGDTWVLQGVISFGHRECRAAEKDTVFSKVSMYIDWLNKLAALKAKTD